MDAAAVQRRVSWTPLVVIAMAQVLLAFNIITLKIAIDAIVTSYDAPASAVKTAIVVYSLAVAGCIMAGARVGPVFGSLRVFRTAVTVFGIAMLAVVLSTDVIAMIVAQVVAGVAAAALVPTSVVLVADNYTGEQQTKALEWLSGVRSISLVPAFLLAGILATYSDWRIAFALMLLLAACIYMLSGKLSSGPRQAGGRIDAVGFALTILAVLLIGLGFNNLTDWGVLRATPTAPFNVLNLSPALLVIACGILLIKLLLIWSHKRRAAGGACLIAPEVIDTPRERSALFSIFTIGAVSSAVTFLIPLYIEIVQGRNSLYTALAMIPFTLSSAAAALLVGRLRGRVRPRVIARYGFLVVAAGLAILGAVIRNDWSDAMVILSMIVAGLGEGALATLLFEALIAAAPSEVADDVEPLCDATSHLAVAVGTTLAGALVIGVLSFAVQRDLALNPVIAAELRTHLNLDKVAFVSNDHLLQTLERTTATPEQVAEAVRINTQARLRALKVSFFALAALALLAFIPNARVRDEDVRTRPRTESQGGDLEARESQRAEKSGRSTVA